MPFQSEAYRTCMVTQGDAYTVIGHFVNAEVAAESLKMTFKSMGVNDFEQTLTRISFRLNNGERREYMLHPLDIYHKPVRLF